MFCLSCGLDSNTVLACEQCGSQLGFPHQRQIVHGDQGLRLLCGVIPE